MCVEDNDIFILQTELILLPLEYINKCPQFRCYFKFSEMFRVKEESSSISSLKDEFTQRIAEAEKKVQLACKERDAAKKVMEV